jgi:hypothetical protein
MANVSGAVQIETRIKHELSLPFQSVAGEQSINVGTLLRQDIGVAVPGLRKRSPVPLDSWGLEVVFYPYGKNG